MKERAMKLVCGKHISKEILRPYSFFWWLCENKPENGMTVIETIVEVLDEWEIPTVEELTDAVIYGWANMLKLEALFRLYKKFGAKTDGEASFAASMWS